MIGEYELNKVMCLDSYKAIKSIPDKSVDIIITDPPYEIDPHGAGFHKNRDYMREIDNEGLTIGIDDDILSEFVRIMKSVNIYIFCNKNQLRQYFDFFKDYNCDLLIWHKTNPIPTVNNKYLSDVEYVFFAREEGVKVYGDYTTLSKVYTSTVNKRDKDLFEHLTPKPVQLIKNFVINSSNKNDIVYDPFSGSGSTAVACSELNRIFIGSEISEKWCNIANDRLKNIDASGQISFFKR